MSDKMQRLVNKINRADIPFETLTNPGSAEVKIMEMHQYHVVAILNTETGVLTMKEYSYNFHELSNLDKLIHVINSGI